MENIENILQKIKDTRLKKGFSQENMAIELGISQGAYTNIEKNNSKLSVDRLIKISEVLEKPIYHFFEATPNKIYNQNVSDSSYGYQQDIENLYQDNKEVYDKLEENYKEMVNLLKEENAFLKKLVKKDLD